MKIKKFWNADKIISTTALIVGVGSLFVIVYQTTLIRQAQYASVLPYLEIYSSQSSNKYLKWNLSNTGLGPAIIKDVRVQYQGKVYEGDLGPFFNEHFKSAGPLYWNGIRNGNLIPAGNDQTLIGGDTTQNKGLQRFFSTYNEEDTIINIPVLEITYSSIYGETWIVTMDESIPRKLKN